jgi:hypothetical protein
MPVLPVAIALADFTTHAQRYRVVAWCRTSNPRFHWKFIRVPFLVSKYQ